MGLFNGRKTVFVDYWGNDSGDKMYDAVFKLVFNLEELGMKLDIANAYNENNDTVVNISGGGSVRIGPGAGARAQIRIDSPFKSKEIEQVVRKTEDQMFAEGFEPLTVNSNGHAQYFIM